MAGKTTERKKKTHSEKRETSLRLEKKNLQNTRKNILSLKSDREEIQTSLAEAINGVVVISKALEDKRVSESIDEKSYGDCIDKIEAFRNTINEKSGPVKQCLQKMESLENILLKDPSLKNEYWSDYSMTGVTLINLVNDVTCVSLETSAFCALNIHTSLSESKGKENE
jgi:hypothetical protein